MEFVGDGSVIRRISSRSFLDEASPRHAENGKAEAKPVFRSERLAVLSWRSLIAPRNDSVKYKIDSYFEYAKTINFDENHDDFKITDFNDDRFYD